MWISRPVYRFKPILKTGKMNSMFGNIFNCCTSCTALVFIAIHSSCLSINTHVVTGQKLNVFQTVGQMLLLYSLKVAQFLLHHNAFGVKRPHLKHWLHTWQYKIDEAVNKFINVDLFMHSLCKSNLIAYAWSLIPPYSFIQHTNWVLYSYQALPYSETRTFKLSVSHLQR